MEGFLKTFVNGLLTVLELPFFVVVFVINLVYALIAFIFLEIKAIILFFMGKSIKKDNYEEKYLTKIKEKQKAKQTINDISQDVEKTSSMEDSFYE